MTAQAELDDEQMDAPTIQVGETAAGEPYTLPVEDLLTARAFVTGKSGSGKSNTASVVAEELLERGHPFLVVDVDGEYHGLKQEHELLHVGADEDRCDLAVGPEHAGKLAELALDQDIPIVLDVSGYLDADVVDELVAATARELFAAEQEARQPFLLVVEEVHEFIPQQGGLDDVGEALIRVAKRGRKRGLGVTGISQRPADVKKDFITQCDWLVWHRLTWDNDTDVVARVVSRDHADAVEDLADGEAFVQADWAETDVERVQFRRKRTIDLGATPGLDDTEQPELKSIGEDLVAELEEISAEQERRRDRIAELKATIDEKDERIAELEDEVERLRTADETLDLLTRRVKGSTAEGEISGELQDRLEEKNERIRELEGEVEDVRDDRDDLQERVDELETEVERLEGIEERVAEAERIEQQLDEAREVLGVDVQEATTQAMPDDVADLRADLATAQQRIEGLEAENDRLREEVEAADGVVVPTDYQDFVQEGVVQGAIDEAKEKSNASPRYVKGVVAAIVQEGGAVDYETVAERLGISDSSNVSKAASTLEALGVLERVQQSPAKVDFDLDGTAEIKERQQRREQAEAVMEDL